MSNVVPLPKLPPRTPLAADIERRELWLRAFCQGTDDAFGHEATIRILERQLARARKRHETGGSNG